MSITHSIPNVKEFLPQNKCDICNFSDANGTWIHNPYVNKPSII